MRRFRWTRKSYRHADHLARLLARYMDLPDHPPAILRRYWELWERHRQYDDPMTHGPSLRTRLDRLKGDDIPF